MRIRALLPLCLLSLTAVTMGQAKPAGMDNFQFHTADMQLLQAKPVQAELKISETQRAAMNKFAEKHRAKLEALEKQYEKQKKPMSEAQSDPKIVGYYLELKTNVMMQLSKVQLKRLSELSLQRVGMAALTDDVVAKKVGLSSSQLTKFRDAFKASGEAYAKAQQKAAGPVLEKYKNKKPKDAKEAEALQKQYQADMAAAMKRAQPELEKIQKSAEVKLKAILTAKQLASYKALQGKTFSPK